MQHFSFDDKAEGFSSVTFEKKTLISINMLHVRFDGNLFEQSYEHDEIEFLNESLLPIKIIPSSNQRD